MNLLDMSIQAGVMITAIALIRALAINRLPKKTFSVLWSVALLRLLVPFSLPSPFSVYSLANRTGLITSKSTAAIVPLSPIAALPQTTATLSISIWVLLWGIGAALCALYFLFAYVRCRRVFAASQPVENEFAAGWFARHTLKRRIEIRQSSCISAPFTYGVFRPVVLMPKQTDWGDTVNMQYVLAHEYTHIRRFDAVAKILLTAALCLHWFNPLVWAMFILSNRDIELSCDEAVVLSFGETMKSAYALALISMEEQKSRLMPFCNSFSKNAIEERIKAIMKIKKTTFASLAMALLLVGGVTTVFATSASAKPDKGSMMTGTVMTRKMDDDSPWQYSTDNGTTWISEADYNTMNPQDEVVWWTYDEYKAYVDKQKAELPRLIGTGCKYLKDGKWVEFTQQSVNESIHRYEDTLEEIKNGAKLSKTVNGDDSITMMSYPPNDGDVSVSYGASITGDDNSTTELGTFSSKEERLVAVKQYCSEQVTAGKMSQDEANELIKEYE